MFKLPKAIAVAAVAGALVGSATSSEAAIWNIDTTGASLHTLPGGGNVVGSFNPNAANLGTGANELSGFFTAGSTQVWAGGTLKLLTDVLSVTYTFLGREAGATNIYAGATGPQSAGSTLPFSFISSLPSIAINGGVKLKSQLAFLLSGDGNTAYAFFDDGGGSPVAGCATKDCDFDDKIVAINATPIPLPAAGLLLIGGLGGLGLVGRRRRGAAA